MRHEIVRDDGFVLVHSEGGGWDIHAPVLSLDGIPADMQAVLADRRRVDVEFDGPDRRGSWFAWALSVDDAEEKIAREVRERLFH